MDKQPWPRAIILVDLNAFFASVEQLDYPELRGRPVAVTNGEQGTCIITCSYEARRFGISTGMRIYHAQKQCPYLVQCPARPERYAKLSTQIMHALETITPDLEVFSVDEAFLDVTHCQHLYGHPEQIGYQVKDLIYKKTGLLCSVGVSGDKTTAKFAAKQHKPDGLTVIPPWEARQQLAHAPVTQLCGVAKGIGRYLANHGVFLCKDMQTIPVQVLTRRFGPLGRRIWLMAQGQDPSPVTQAHAAPKSVGHGKVLPPHTTDETIIATYLRHMAEKVAKRLRTHQLEAQKYFIGLRTPEGMIGDKLSLERPSHDGKAIFQLCRFVLSGYWEQQTVSQVQVTALDPKPAALQLELFAPMEPERKQINHTMDSINNRFGPYMLTPAPLVNRSSMPNVIAPAWRPDGIKNSV